jgi:ABC-type glycerol-3-phosphate transport system substrate-binding protein
MMNLKSIKMSLKLVFVLLILLIGCFFILNASAQQPTIRIWTWKGIEDPEKLMPILQDFEKKYNCKIMHEGYSYPDMLSKPLIAAEANALPDVLEIAADSIMPILVEKGALENLDPYIEKAGGKEFLDRFSESVIMTYKGHHYCVSEFPYNLEFLYNTNMFKEKFNPPKNWGELESICKALTDKEKGVYGITIPGNDPETLIYLSYFIVQNGGRIGLAKELGQVPDREVKIEDIGINKPEAIEALEFALHLAKEYGTPFVGTDYKMARESFIRGEAAIIFDGPHTIAFMGSNYDPSFRISSDRMPIGPIGKPAGLVVPGDTTLAISSTAKNKDLCFQLLDYITSDEVMTKYALAASTTPGNKHASEVLAKSDIRSLPAIEGLQGTEPEWYVIPLYSSLPPQTGAALDIFIAEIQKAALGEKTVQKAMDDVANGWKKLWDEWQNTYK